MKSLFIKVIFQSDEFLGHTVQAVRWHRRGGLGLVGMNASLVVPWLTLLRKPCAEEKPHAEEQAFLFFSSCTRGIW